MDQFKVYKANTGLQEEAKAKKRILARHPRRMRLLIVFLVLIAATSLFLAWYMRPPTAQVNRMLKELGLLPLPASTTDLHIAIKKRTFIKFSAEPAIVAEFAKQRSKLPLRDIALDPINWQDIVPSLSWFRPPTYWDDVRSVESQQDGDNVVVMIIDDERNTVYIVLPLQEGRFDDIVKWLHELI